MENGNADKTAFAEEMVGLLNQGKVEEAIQSSCLILCNPKVDAAVASPLHARDGRLHIV